MRAPHHSWHWTLLAALCAAGCGANDDEKNAVSTPSGVKYVDLVPGDGDPVGPADTVEVEYLGRLRADASEYESSRKVGRPFTLVMKGPWSYPFSAGMAEAVAGMKPGGKRRLFVPAARGFGAAGAGDKVPPDSDLVIDVELKQIVKVLPLQSEDL